jgi:colicin import membrane protein
MDAHLWHQLEVTNMRWTALALVCLGCASGSGTRIEDSWLARVPADRLSEVHASRAAKRAAEDQVLRARATTQDAERAITVVRKEEESAAAMREAELASLEAAKARGQADGINQAERRIKDATAHQSAARARLEWQRNLIDVSKARELLREREVEVADARLDLAEFEALREHGDVRVKPLSESSFREEIEEAERRVDRARRSLDRRARDAEGARARFEGLKDQARGYGGSGQ